MLTLPKPVKQRIASEFRFAADGMAKAADLPTKLYYFSALFGETNRVFNVSWQRELGLMHLVLQETYRQIHAGVTEMQSGFDRGIIGIPAALPEELTKIGLDLAVLFEDNKIDEVKLFNILARAAELTYVTTGNGHYLLLRGKITL